MIFLDTLTMDAPKRTSEGYLAVRAKAARMGLYDYLGSEIDPEGKNFKPNQIVKVYRSEDEVMSRKSIHSFLMKPITDDHPNEAVTSDNWSRVAKGAIAGAVRDGDYVAFDLVVMDASLASKIENKDKFELSNGYSCDVVVGDGTTPSGEKYQARQVGISGNHIAVVKTGRAGHECRIADSVALCDSAPKNLFSAVDGETKVADAMKIIRDGVTVEVNDAFIASLDAKIAKLTSELATANTSNGTLAASVAVKDAEIAALNSKLKDAEITPAKLHAAAAALSLVADAAKRVVPTLDTKALDEAGIKSAVIAAKLGDAAKTITSVDAINAAFTVLSATVADADPVRDSLLGHKPAAIPSHQMTIDASRKAVDHMNAWRNAN